MLSSISHVISLAMLLALQAVAQTPVSEDVFDNIIKYAGLAAASYANDCAQPPPNTLVVEYFTDNDTDTQGTLFRDEVAKEIIVSFRGTSTPADLETDLAFNLVPLNGPGTQCQGCKVHRGFQTSFAAVGSAMAATIKAEVASHSDYAVIVTGHSLGGGIAAVATSSFITQGISVSSVYTYGEPRNGDAAWAKYISDRIPDNRYFRVTNYNDGVPQIPPPVLGYVHHGKEFWLSKESDNTASTTLDCGIESTNCNAGVSFGSNPINRAHLTYGNMVIGNSLFVEACGAKYP